MEIKLKLNTENAKQEIAEFKQFVESQNPQGVKLSLVTKSHEAGKLGVDWINLLQVGLTTTGSGLAIKGFFDLLKAYLVDLKQHKITAALEEKNKEKEIKGQIIEKMIENSLATIIIKDDEGNEQNIPINRFSTEELETVLRYL